jgi:hypothetical protein
MGLRFSPNRSDVATGQEIQTRDRGGMPRSLGIGFDIGKNVAIAHLSSHSEAKVVFIIQNVIANQKDPAR